LSKPPPPFQKRLGYRFREPGLLEQALTHRSYGTPNNERLEFLGDGVLGCAIAEALCARFPGMPEGKLTPLRAALVREECLSEVARDLKLDDYVRLGEGERSGAAEVRPSILADTLEAVFGAVFLDGGYEQARAAILRVYGERIDALDPEAAVKDAKTRLQEALQARRLKLPQYRVTAVKGEAHRQTFEVECVAEDLGLRAVGEGSSRRRAEQQAAEGVLSRIGS
jgi:ribonuclease-3